MKLEIYWPMEILFGWSVLSDLYFNHET